MKRRTEALAVMAGRPGAWTPADLAAARHCANTLVHPRALHGQTPAQVWSQRRHLDADARDAFQATVAARRVDVRQENGWSNDTPLNVPEARMVDRQALERALVEHAYLLVSRRRIPLTIPGRKAARIR